jgi:transposase
MFDRHEVWTLHNTGEYSQRRIAKTLGISRTSVQRILSEAPITSNDVLHERDARKARGVGRPCLADQLAPSLAQWIEAEPKLSGREALRRLREQGRKLGDSTFYRAWQQARGTADIPEPVMVRFEGVPGEFAQFDFGECDIRLGNGSTRRVHFACYRLKYSRWMYVQVVPDQKVESLIRALLNGFASAGGVPLSVVFDRPKTVVIGKNSEGLPKWNTTLARAAIDYGFVIELCMPRAGWQKGSVEALVKFVKGDFFTQRIFADVEQDLPSQLLGWLTQVNMQRKCRATNVVPADLLPEEQTRLRKLAIEPDRYGLVFPVFIGPTSVVEFRGQRYAMPPQAASRPATLSLLPDRVHIITQNGKHEVTHPRYPINGISYLPGQRAAILAKVAGDRGRTYFMRECLLQLGPVAEVYITELVHARPYVWAGDIETLFHLLEKVGEVRFRSLLERAHAKRLFGAEYVQQLHRSLPSTLAELPLQQVQLGRGGVQ